MASSTEQSGMRYASGWQRTLAWVIDTTILITVLLVTSRVVWSLVPAVYIEEPFRAMQLYSQRELDAFVYTFILFTFFVAAYQILLPRYFVGSTPGHRVARIKLVQPDGTPLRTASCVRRFVITVLKCLLLFLAGPLVAINGGNEALSWVGLVAPILFILVSYLMALRNPDGAWLWERLGNYRFVERD